MVKAQHIRQYTYVYSAIEPKTGESVSLIMPYADTACMNVFLEELSGRYADDELVLVLDGASWHRSKGLVVPSNICLVCLPPYSTELNPVEQLWAKMKWALTSLIRSGQTLEEAFHSFFQNTTYYI